MKLPIRLATLALLPWTLAAAPRAAAQGLSATYEVRFDATWTEVTHPGAYPNNAHFSPLVGGTHSSAVQFWTAGGIASPGIESMAETGATFQLNQEVNAAIAAGTAGQRIAGPGANSPGSATTTFTVTDQFPLVTLVSMTAPSPDWFVGVDSLDLRPNGQFEKSLVVQLYNWDAGTDSGTWFTSANQDTNPQDPIALQTTGPFFGVTPLGTFTFTRLTNASTYCTAKPNSQGCSAQLAFSGTPSLSDPNPFQITATGVLNNKAGLFFYGLSGTATIPFQGGTLCVQPPLRRTPIQVSGGNPPPDDCSGTYGFDFNTWAQSGADPLLAVGSRVDAQFWSRDPQHADGTGVALTNAIDFDLCP